MAARPQGREAAGKDVGCGRPVLELRVCVGQLAADAQVECWGAFGICQAVGYGKELDPGGWLIRALESCGLAWRVVRIPPERQAAKLQRAPSIP